MIALSILVYHFAIALFFTFYEIAIIGVAFVFGTEITKFPPTIKKTISKSSNILEFFLLVLKLNQMTFAIILSVTKLTFVA